MMARAIIRGGGHPLLGLVDGEAYFALGVTGFDMPTDGLGEFMDLRQVGPLLFRARARCSPMPAA